MKLISCHVVNYGCLNNFTYEFDKNINVICRENGWGKSTFASFIASMLYGLDSSSKRNIAENERRHFTPWNGGRFGGFLEFSHNEHEYRVERYFASKEKDDTFALYDLKTMLKSEDFSTNLGIEIFGIDRAGFINSLFFKQGQMLFTYNNTLTAKLSSISNNSDDISQYENAVVLLDKALKFYKKTGKRGEIPALVDETEEIDGKIQAAIDAAANADEISARIAMLKKACSTLENQLTALNDEIEMAAVFESYYNYLDLKEKAEEIEARLDKNEDFFHDELPEEIDINTYINMCGELLQLESKVSAIDTLELENSIKTLKNQLNTNYQKYSPNTSENNTTYNKDKTFTQKPHNKKLLDFLLMKSNIYGIFISLVIGIVGGFFFDIPVGILLFLIGVCTTFFISNTDYTDSVYETEPTDGPDSEFVSEENSKDSAVNDKLIQILYQMEDKLRADKNLKKRTLQQIQDIRKDIQSYLSRYYELAENEPVNKLDNLLRELKLRLAYYRNTLSESIKINKNIDAFLANHAEISKLSDEDLDKKPEAVRQISELKQEEELIHRQYNQYTEQIGRLQSELDMFNESADEFQELTERKQRIMVQIEEYSDKYRILELTREFLTKAKQDYTEEYLRSIERNFSKYARYFTSTSQGNGPTGNGDLGACNTSDANGDLGACNTSGANGDLGACNTSGANGDLGTCNTSGANGDLGTCNTSGANGDLGFNSKLLNVHFNSNFEVLLDDDGTLREPIWYSTGNRDLITICSRFSLIDDLFPNESPFIIMDDPFVNLDDDTSRSAFEMLKQISKKWQIIFFTCKSEVAAELTKSDKKA